MKQFANVYQRVSGMMLQVREQPDVPSASCPSPGLLRTCPFLKLADFFMSQISTPNKMKITDYTFICGNVWSYLF